MEDSQPPLPPGPPPPPSYDGYCDPQLEWQMYQVPPISMMLHQEAEAWRALLALHASVVAKARELSGERLEDSLRYDESSETSDQREATYMQSLSSLLQNTDALSTELLKLRGLRRARREVMVAAHAETMRAHTDETLALGASLGNGGSMSLATVTAEVRLAGQSLRNQLSQARALLVALQEAEASQLASNACIVMGVRTGEDTVFYSVDEVMRAVFERSSTITEDAIAEALSKMRVGESGGEAMTAPNRRNMPRKGKK